MHNGQDDAGKTGTFEAYTTTYPQQLSKILPCKHIPNPSLSKKLTCIHIHNPNLSKWFTCKHIHSPKLRESRLESGFHISECKLKVLNAILNFLNY